MTRNLTPDSNGLPEGLTEKEFVTVMRTGEDIHCEKFPSDVICALGPDTLTLQVMPWPAYHGLRIADLKAGLRLSQRPSSGRTLQHRREWLPRIFRSCRWLTKLRLPVHQ
jgi:hypothetical protein